MATETLQNIIASHRLDAGELDLLKLNAGISYHKSMQRALLYEEALRLSIFSDIGRMGFSQSLNVNGLGSLNGSTWGFKILLLNDEIIVHQWYSNEINALASNPYYEVKDKLRNLIDSVNKQWGVPKSVLMPILLPAIDRYFETITSADANRRIVELALDMCRYRDKHGNYPEKLDELVPDYIAFVPLDPFDGKSMRLKQVDGKLVVYSVGPDEIDDGGMPYNQETRKGDITFELPNKRD
jgi:hypothetical protein